MVTDDGDAKVCNLSVPVTVDIDVSLNNPILVMQ
jgi:hypothetical protein